MKNWLILFISLHSILLFSQEKDSIRLYYLGGQSNMDGYGYNSELPEYLNKTFDNVYIFHGNPAPDNEQNGGIGVWENLKPGHGGWMFTSSEKGNNLTDRFGPELSFAAKMQELYPNEKIALIKYSRGGTALDTIAPSYGCWEPSYKGVNGVNQYDHFLSTLNNAYSSKDIDGDGVEDILVPMGIIWMQGEADAVNLNASINYYYNLHQMIALIRAAFRADDLAVVLGKISDSGQDEDGIVWDYLDLVQAAQEEFVRKDANASIVRKTKFLNYSDNAHYNSQGFIDLGEEFAKEIYKLNNQNTENE